MMTWKLASALAFVTGLVVVIVYDLVAYACGGKEATISDVWLSTASWSRFFVVVSCFAAGVLFGHLFLPQVIDRR